jgi:ribosomal protein S12 methylthiotransferase accessory factor YcaO
MALVSLKVNRWIVRMTPGDENLLTMLETSLAGEFRLMSIDVGDCPVFFAAAMPIQTVSAKSIPRIPCGRGFTRAEAALSAFGEAVELRACLATESKVTGLAKLAVDGLARVRGENLKTAQPVELLAQHVYLDWAEIAGEPEVFRASTNGCAAWPNLQGATDRGLLESIERDARALWWYGRLQCPKLPLHVLDEVQPRLAWWLQHRQREHAWIDITCDTLVPVIAAVSWEPGGNNVAIGSAAAPSLSAALISATTEMLQTELALEMGNVADNDELRDWQRSANAHDLPQLSGFASEAEAKALSRPVCEHLLALGFEVVRYNFTEPGDILKTVRMITSELGGIRQYRRPQRIMDYIARNPSLTTVRTIAELDPRETY